MAIEFPPNHRLTTIRAATVRLNLLGGVGTYAQVAICDEETRPVLMNVTQMFSPRTYQIIDELARSIEQDVYDTLSAPDPVRRLGEDEDDGLTFG